VWLFFALSKVAVFSLSENALTRIPNFVILMMSSVVAIIYGLPFVAKALGTAVATDAVANPI
jgi:hypothetical protein